MLNTIAANTIVTNTVACSHHWVLEGDTAETTRGVCQRCGSIKEFQNHLPGDRYAKEWREARIAGTTMARIATGRMESLDD